MYCCHNTPLQSVTVQFMYFHCAQRYCNTTYVAVRTHLYRPSDYDILCTFSVHNITVRHNVLLSEHITTVRNSITFLTFIS